MAGRDQQDAFLDDDSEESWYSRIIIIPISPCLTRRCSPLCVEEFDLSDKNFKPCPCGYQVHSPATLRRVGLYLRDTPLGLPILLQQHQEQHERAVSGLPAPI